MSADAMGAGTGPDHRTGKGGGGRRGRAQGQGAGVGHTGQGIVQGRGQRTLNFIAKAAKWRFYMTFHKVLQFAVQLFLPFSLRTFE